MARYEHLPIYKKSLELAIFIERVVAGFSRAHRYGLGARLQTTVQEMICLVVKAQNASNKQPFLQQLRVEIEVFKTLLHIAKEVRVFKSLGAYSQAAGLAVELGRQTEGWLKASHKLRSPESRPTNPQGGQP